VKLTVEKESSFYLLSDLPLHRQVQVGRLVALILKSTS